MTRAFRPAPHAPRRQTAFTLIELMVVVGILGLLTALAVVGFRVVGSASRARATEGALENCKGLLATYKLTSQLDSLLDQTVIDAATGATRLRWQRAWAATGLPNDLMNALAIAPGIASGTTGAAETSLPQRLTNERYLRDETARVIRRLMSVPENRKSIEAMPSDRLLKVKYPTAIANFAAVPVGDPPEYTLAATNLTEGVVLVDGSGHPIYFIPGGGLAYVNVGYLGTGDKSAKANYDRQVTVRATDRNPFWASPGPDGDLTTGDDNIYSTAVDTK